MIYSTAKADKKMITLLSNSFFVGENTQQRRRWKRTPTKAKTNTLGKVEMFNDKPILIRNINISSLPNGLHFIKVQKTDGTIKISKLLIQH